MAAAAGTCTAAAAGDRSCFPASSKLSARRNKFYSISMRRQSIPNYPPTQLRAPAPGMISQTFTDSKKQGRAAFIPYITAGDPDLSTTAEALKLLSSCGADIIELGLPFSDPLMDGPTIQASHGRALANKTDARAVFSMLKEVVPHISCPIVIFSYYNLILSQRKEWFLSSLEDVGVKGLMVPDLPFEESASLNEAAAEKNISMVHFTTPATARTRMRAIADASRGFIYLISSAGVTGARSTVNPQVEHILREIKKETAKPVAVGFGISKPEHVKQLTSWGADGVIVGSAIVKVLGEAKSKEEGLKHMECYVKSLVDALVVPPPRHHRPLHAPYASLMDDCRLLVNQK